MKQLKKILGIVWIMVALALGYFLLSFGWPKFISGTQEGLVFGIIILFILMPLIVIGLGLFGYYAFLGEYNLDETKE